MGARSNIYLEKLKDLPRQLAERQAEDEEDLPEDEKFWLLLRRKIAGAN